MQTPISPKVTAAGLAGVISALLLSVITLITPDLFDGLGKWSGLAYGLTIAVVTAVAGYLKNDPLRVTQPVPSDPPAPAATSVVVNAPTTAAELAAPTTFTATKAKIDALPAESVVPVVDAPAEVAPILPN